MAIESIVSDLIFLPRRGRVGIDFSRLDNPSFVMRTVLWLPYFIVFTFFSCYMASSLAAGPTGEDEALSALRTGRLPLALSQDGNWIVHLDANLVLHRSHIQDIKQHQQIKLPWFPAAISASQTGLKVAFTSYGTCSGLVAFGSGKPQVHILKSTCPSFTGGDETDNSNAGEFYGSKSIAISSDGKKLAVEGISGRLFIVDAATEKYLFEIPIGPASWSAPLLHLAFVDQDRKLLVVQAIKGEGWESAAGDSDMLFAVWDLEKRELFSFYHSNSFQLNAEDFLWGFSEASGELWALKTSDDYWDGRNKHKPFELLSFNLKQCGSANTLSFKSSRRHILELSADPYGRWLATVEADGLLERYDGKQPENPVLVIRDSASGKALRTIKLSKPVRSLASTPKGDVLVGIEAREVITEPNNLTTLRITGGGKLFRHTTTAELRLHPQAHSWNAQRCLIEDEAHDARNIVSTNVKPVKLYEISLEATAKEQTIDSCYSSYVPTGKFGLSKDGSLWIDRSLAYIEQIDLLTGKRLRAVTTPRKEGVCSIPLFTKKQFLNVQGDTVTLRAFPEQGIEKDRRILVRKPGWRAAAIVRGSTWVGIGWTKLKPGVSKNGEAENSYVEAIYELDTGKLIQETAPGIEDFSYEPPQQDIKPGEYRWEISYMRSPRSQHRSESDGKIKTVLWDGLRLGGKSRAHTGEPYAAQLIDLGLGKAAVIWPDQVVMYDAATRQRLANIPLKAANVQWSETQRLLLIEVLYDDEMAGRTSRLHAYRVD